MRLSKTRRNPRQMAPINSQKPAIFSYHASGKGEVPGGKARQFSSPDARKRTKVRWEYLPGYLSLLAIAAGVVYASSLSNQAQLSIVEGRGTALQRPEEVYLQTAEKYLSGSILNKTKLSVNRKLIIDKLKADFPEIKDANITLGLLRHKPVLSMSIRQAAFLFNTKNGVFVVDSSGKVVGNAAEYAALKNSNLIPVLDESGLEAGVGKQLINSADARYISIVREQLATQNISVEMVVLPLAPREITLRLVGEKYVLRLSLDNEPSQSAGSYLAASRNFGKGGIGKPQEYVDLRVEERVYLH